MKICALLPVVTVVGATSFANLFALSAQAQSVSIPVTNGNFAVTRLQSTGAYQYVTLPTFLTPVGTITITGGLANQAAFQSLVPITTDTPAGAYLGSLSGAVSLTDGRTGTFTDTGFATVRGLATATIASTGAPTTYTPTSDPANYNRNFVRDTTVSFVVKSGALHVPAASLSSYAVPQFTIPVSGGTFVVNDAVGTGHATMSIQSLLTPIGTTNLTLALPAFTRESGIRYLAEDVNRAIAINGLVSGTVALTDGRVATLSNRLVTLQGTAKRISAGQNYVFNLGIRNEEATLTGTFTNGVISIPETDVVTPAVPLPPREPGVPGRPEPVVRNLPGAIAQAPPLPSPNPPTQTDFVFSLAPQVNLGGEPDDFLRLVERPAQQSDRFDDEEPSPLTVSRIHPYLQAR